MIEQLLVREDGFEIFQGTLMSKKIWHASSFLDINHPIISERKEIYYETYIHIINSGLESDLTQRRI